jgi:hypothetical protein
MFFRNDAPKRTGAAYSARRPAAGAYVGSLAVYSGLILALIWPTLPSYMWTGHDSFFPIVRMDGMARIWEAGGPIQAPWLPDMAFGYGWPFFTFYAPLGYIVGATGIVGLGLSSGAATKLSFYLALWLSGFFMHALAYLIGRREGDPRAAERALAAGAIYALTPYHLTDMFVRVALAESWAWATAAALFWAVEWSRSRPWPGCVAIALAYLSVVMKRLDNKREHGTTLVIVQGEVPKNLPLPGEPQMFNKLRAICLFFLVALPFFTQQVSAQGGAFIETLDYRIINLHSPWNFAGGAWSFDNQQDYFITHEKPNYPGWDFELNILKKQIDVAMQHDVNTFRIICDKPGSIAEAIQQQEYCSQAVDLPINPNPGSPHPRLVEAWDKIRQVVTYIGTKNGKVILCFYLGYDYANEYQALPEQCPIGVPLCQCPLTYTWPFLENGQANPNYRWIWRPKHDIYFGSIDERLTKTSSQVSGGVGEHVILYEITNEAVDDFLFFGIAKNYPPVNHHAEALNINPHPNSASYIEPNEMLTVFYQYGGNDRVANLSQIIGNARNWLIYGKGVPTSKLSMGCAGPMASAIINDNVVIYRNSYNNTLATGNGCGFNDNYTNIHFYGAGPILEHIINWVYDRRHIGQTSGLTLPQPPKPIIFGELGQLFTDHQIRMPIDLNGNNISFENTQRRYAAAYHLGAIGYIENNNPSYEIIGAGFWASCSWNKDFYNNPGVDGILGTADDYPDRINGHSNAGPDTLAYTMDDGNDSNAHGQNIAHWGLMEIYFDAEYGNPANYPLAGDPNGSFVVVPTHALKSIAAAWSPWAGPNPDIDSFCLNVLPSEPNQPAPQAINSTNKIVTITSPWDFAGLYWPDDENVLNLANNYMGKKYGSNPFHSGSLQYFNTQQWIEYPGWEFEKKVLFGNQYPTIDYLPIYQGKGSPGYKGQFWYLKNELGCNTIRIICDRPMMYALAHQYASTQTEKNSALAAMNATWDKILEVVTNAKDNQINVIICFNLGYRANYAAGTWVWESAEDIYWQNLPSELFNTPLSNSIIYYEISNGGDDFLFKGYALPKGATPQGYVDLLCNHQSSRVHALRDIISVVKNNYLLPHGVPSAKISMACTHPISAYVINTPSNINISSNGVKGCGLNASNIGILEYVGIWTGVNSLNNLNWLNTKTSANYRIEGLGNYSLNIYNNINCNPELLQAIDIIEDMETLAQFNLSTSRINGVGFRMSCDWQHTYNSTLTTDDHRQLDNLKGLLEIELDSKPGNRTDPTVIGYQHPNSIYWNPAFISYANTHYNPRATFTVYAREAVWAIKTRW